MGKRGQKLCPEGHVNGPRAFYCKVCNHEFSFKANVKKARGGRNGAKVDWKSLEPDDIIKVLCGSGPYYIGREGKVCMGYHGLFKVKHVYGNGLLCYPAENRQGEASFIYMGDEKLSKTGTTLRSHKIRKVDNKYVRSKK